MNLLAAELIKQARFDTVRYYCKLLSESASSLAKQNTENGIPVYRVITKSIGDSYYYTAMSYYYQAKYDNAKENFTQAAPYYEKCGFLKNAGACRQNLGAIYYFQGNYDKALESYIATTKHYEAIGYTKGVADCHVNTGSTYRILGKPEIGLEHYLIALEKYKEINDLPGISLSYMNIGVNHLDRKEWDQAIESNQKSIAIKTQLGDKKGLAESHCNIGAAYLEKNELKKSFENYSTAVTYYEELNDKQGLSFAYNYTGKVCLKMGNTDKGIGLLNKGLSLAAEIGIKDMMREADSSLAIAYEQKKDYKSAYSFHQKFAAIKDSLYSEETSKKFAEMNANYENDKKQKQIELIKAEQEKERAVADEKSRIQKIIIFCVGIGLLIVIIFSAFILRSLKLTRHQKVIIEEKQKEILESIHYAKRIQTSLLPTEKYMARYLKDPS